MSSTPPPQKKKEVRNDISQLIMGLLAGNIFCSKGHWPSWIFTIFDKTRQNAYFKI